MLAFTADNHLGLTAQWSIKDRKDDFLKAFENVINTRLMLLLSEEICLRRHIRRRSASNSYKSRCEGYR